jgi:hypothetical protein
MVGTDEVGALATQTGTSAAIPPSGLKELLGEPVHTYATHSDEIYAALDTAYGSNVVTTRAPQDSKAFDDALTTRRVYLQDLLNPNSQSILPLEDALPVMEELYVLVHVHGGNLRSDPNDHRRRDRPKYDPDGIISMVFKRYLFCVQNDEGDVKGAAIAIQKLVGRSLSIDGLVPVQRETTLSRPTRPEIQSAVQSVHGKYTEGMKTAYETADAVKIMECQNPAEKFLANHVTTAV